VRDAVGGEAFGLGDGGGTEVYGIVFSACLEDETFWDDVSDCQS
jgi:hypothetical protein